MHANTDGLDQNQQYENYTKLEWQAGKIDIRGIL
jgi:hypothetical protein